MKLFSKFIPVCKVLTGIGLMLFSVVKAQPSSNGTIRNPSPAIWFLTVAPDARAAAMGDAGVASTPDANSTYWNASKLAFADRDFGASVSYTPWLRTLINDRWMAYATAYKKLGKRQALAASVNYFNHDYVYFSSIAYTGSYANRAIQMAFNATYAVQLGKNFSMGLTLKYISSNLQGYLTSNGVSLKAGRTIAGDVSAYYRKQVNSKISWAFGTVISNLGGKMSYGSGADAGFIPTTLKIGGGFSYQPNRRHQFNFIADLGKLMVPTPDSTRNVAAKPLIGGIFGSFNDAPGGFREEMQEIVLSLGTEYWYKNTLALRAGFYGENKNKAGRKYFTTGAGLRLFKNYQADFSYLIPAQEFSPLARTFRVSLSAYIR